MRKILLLPLMCLVSCLSGPEERLTLYHSDSLPDNEIQPITRPDDFPEIETGFVVVEAESIPEVLLTRTVPAKPEDSPEYVKTETAVQQQDGQQQKKKQQQQQQQTSPVTQLPGEQVTAVSGKPFTIQLSDKGWVYQPDTLSQPDVRFMDKQYTADGTSFVFQISGGGTRILSFERQDNMAGQKQAIKISVTMCDGSMTGVVADNGDTTVQKVMAEDTRPAVIRLEEAVGKKDLAVITGILSNPDLAAMAEPELLLKSWRILEQMGGDPAVRSMTIDRLLELYPENVDITPELLYFRAILLEANTSQKSLKKAYALYDLVYSQYPVSPWSEKAHERMIYLDRHYFKVR